ncbi:hypothetical protein C0J52_01926, partial [Blattella germanica]
DEVLDILYNDDSGDDLIPELDSNSDSESDNEIPISPVARLIEQHHSSRGGVITTFFSPRKMAPLDPKPPQKAPPQPRPSASVSASRTPMRTCPPAPAQNPGPPPPAPKVRAPEEAPTQPTFAQVTARGTKRAKQSQQARVSDAPPPPKEQRPDCPRREGRNSSTGENLKPPSPPKSQVKKAATSSRLIPPSAREPGRPGARCLYFKCPAHGSAPCVNPHEDWETEQFVWLLQGINPQLTFRALMNGPAEMTRRLNARPSLST